MTDRSGEIGARQVLDEIRDLSALYRGRFSEWPVQVRLDSARMHALASGLDRESFGVLASRVQLAVRDTPGASAGGRGVVELVGQPEPALVDLAVTWIGAIIPASGETPIAVKTEFWLELADEALRENPGADELDVLDLVRAHPTGNPELRFRDEPSRRDALLFQLVYIASFGFDGVQPKLLALGRYSYGVGESEQTHVQLVLHRSEGGLARTDAPYELLERFPVPRNEWRQTVLELAGSLAELARGLAGE